MEISVRATVSTQCPKICTPGQGPENTACGCSRSAHGASILPCQAVAPTRAPLPRRGRLLFRSDVIRTLQTRHNVVPGNAGDWIRLSGKRLNCRSEAPQTAESCKSSQSPADPLLEHPICGKCWSTCPEPALQTAITGCHEERCKGGDRWRNFPAGYASAGRTASEQDSCRRTYGLTIQPGGSPASSRGCSLGSARIIYSPGCRLPPNEPTTSLRSKTPTTPAWFSPTKLPWM